MYYPTLIMASLIKKIKKGRPYYYAVESARINGKPRIVWQKYLGTLDAIVKRTQVPQLSEPQKIMIFEAGAVAALLHIAQSLNFLEVINEIIPMSGEQEDEPTIGHYMLLVALNQALASGSELNLNDWYEQTILKRLWGYPKSMFSRQCFWDHMNVVNNETIKKVENALVLQIQKEFDLDPHISLYDTTHFFICPSSLNLLSTLPVEGCSKPKRYDLRQASFTLLATRNFQIPMLYHTYVDNIPDAKLFPMISSELLTRYTELTGGYKEATLILDKSNLSEEAMKDLITRDIHFIVALSANLFPEVLPTPQDQFKDIPNEQGTRAFTTNIEMWGKKCQLVVVYKESLFIQQLSGVTQNMITCQKKLLDLQKYLNKWRKRKTHGKRPTIRMVHKQLHEILSVQFMKDLFKVEIYEKNHLPALHFIIDHNALRKLSDEHLGKIILITDQIDWAVEHIIETYYNLSAVEEHFKNMKNLQLPCLQQPSYQWNEQKLRVHGFYCNLALLLSTLVHVKVQQAGIDIPFSALLEELSSIKEVTVVYPPDTSIESHTVLSSMSPHQQKLFHILEIQEIIHTG